MKEVNLFWDFDNTLGYRDGILVRKYSEEAIYYAEDLFSALELVEGII